MTYTPGKVLFWDGSKGLFEDHLGNTHQFEVKDVYLEDLKMLKEGCHIVYSGYGLIELSTAAFMRYVGDYY